VLCCAVRVLLQPLSESISSLHDAAKWGDLEATERLLNEGADVNGVVRGTGGGGGAVGFVGSRPHITKGGQAWWVEFVERLG